MLKLCSINMIKQKARNFEHAMSMSVYSYLDRVHFSEEAPDPIHARATKVY